MELTAVLFNLIKCELLDIEPEQNIVDSIDEDSLQSLYKVAKAHDIANIVGSVITKLGKASGEIKQKFEKQQMLALYRYEQSKYELAQLTAFLNDNKIPFISLKGAVLRNYYREPWQRTSCDIDVLVHKEDLERAKDLLIEKLGYKLHLIGSHDIGFFTPSGVHVELHYSLIEEDVATKADIPLEQVWDFSKPKADLPMDYEMSNEMFYYYHIAHMAKHFLIGGCGLRPFIDLFVMRSAFEFDEAKKNELLEEGGLLKFAEQIEALCSVWLCGEKHSELTLQMQEYIFKGGVYGTMQNRVAIQQTQAGGKFGYAISRIWLPLDKLKFKYPILNKHKWLLPVCEVRRWFRLVFCGSLKKSKKEFEVNSNLTKEKADSAQNLLTQLELF